MRMRSIATSPLDQEGLSSIVAGAIIVLLAVACVVLWYAHRRDRERAEAHRIRQQSGFKMLLRAQRARIEDVMERSVAARAIPGQGMQQQLERLERVVKEGVDRLDERVESLLKQDADRQERLRTGLAGAMHDLRLATSYNLRYLLESVGLQGALEHLRRSLEAPGEVEVSIDASDAAGLASAQGLNAYKLVTDAVGVLLATAGVDRSVIRLMQKGAGLRLIAKGHGALNAEVIIASEGSARLAARVKRLHGSLHDDHLSPGVRVISVSIPTC